MAAVDVGQVIVKRLQLSNNYNQTVLKNGDRDEGVQEIYTMSSTLRRQKNEIPACWEADFIAAFNKTTKNTESWFDKGFHCQLNLPYSQVKQNNTIRAETILLFNWSEPQLISNNFDK